MANAMKCALSGLIALLPVMATAENSVTRWTEHALQSVRAANVGIPNAGRLYAMTTIAMHDAVNGIDTARHHGREHAMVPPAGAPARGHREAAVAAAAHAVLVALVPTQAAVLDTALADDLAALGASDPRVIAGRSWGQLVGQKVLALRASDGTQSAVNMPAGTGIGVHRALFDARWRNMTPFGIQSKAPYASAPPPALTSAEYVTAFNDVKMFGKQDGDATRNEIALFWLAEGGTVRETGMWLQAALAIVEQEGTDRSLSATARLLARVAMAIADSVVVSWDCKATYFTWRPFVAIREADLDGNADTQPDLTWIPRNISVGGSPEFNSGTSMFAGSAATVIEAFYWPRRIPFCFATDRAPNGPRCYSRPLEAAIEAGRSRIYQGIHFQFSNQDARDNGRRIGREIALNRLRRCVGGGRVCLP